MTNYEKYEETIDLILQQGGMIAFNKDTKEIMDCQQLNCENCLFSYRYNDYNYCNMNRIKWLVSEYKEEVDWSKVLIDTPVLVSVGGDFWLNRYFAGVDDKGRLFMFPNGRTSWSNTGYGRMPVPSKYIKLAEVK